MKDNMKKLEESADKIDGKTDGAAKRVFDAVVASRFTAFIIGGAVVALILIGANLC